MRNYCRVMKIKYRKLGNTGFDVSEISFGTWQIGGKRWHGPSDSESVKLLQESRELGVNLFDVAVVYGQYKDKQGNMQSRSQELLGEAFESTRDNVIYCLKLGQFDEYTHRHDFNPERIVDQFSQSLRRLKTDYIDIGLIHAPTLDKVKDGRAISILQTLRALGKIRAIGYSFENEPNHVNEAITQDIDVIMLQYNLLDNDCEDSIKKASDHGVGILVGGPFKRGYLTGEYQTIEDIESQPDDYWKWNLRYNKGKVEQLLGRVNAQLDQVESPSELRRKSLEFVLSQPVSSAVIGHRSLVEVKENISLMEGN